MSAVSFTWDQTAPADGDGAGFGAGQIRSLKTNLQVALDAEHLFPTSTGNAGAHRAGSARVFVGPSSQISSADTTGRLMYDTTNESLVYLSSTSTVHLATRRGISAAGATPGCAPGQRLVTSFLSVSLASWPSPGQAWPVSYAATPYAVCSLQSTAVAPIDLKKGSMAYVAENSTTGCVVAVYDSDTGLPSTTQRVVHVMAVGPVAY